MSIKSDKWIRRMAQQHGLIEPFEPGQVRIGEGGGRLISYGTSSYGYDVRCAREFKIFTNINSTIVDPKQFDEKSFVDVAADVCIIPPNSFALARTVEYFRIPRNVLTVCLGKCVTGDTRVVDADTGAYLPITAMRWGRSTLSLEQGRLAKARVSDFIPQGRKPIFELRTRDGLRIRATANHPFRMRNGWVALSELRPGDRIAAARNIPVFGSTAMPDWEATLLGLLISQGRFDTAQHGPTYTTADPALVRLLESAVAQSGLGAVAAEGRHGYRLVERTDRAGTSQTNRAYGWLERHGLAVAAADQCVPQAIFTAPEHSVRLFLQALFAVEGALQAADTDVSLEYCAHSRRLIEDLHHLLLRFGILSVMRDRTGGSGTDRCRIRIADPQQVLRFADRIGLSPGCAQQRRLDSRILPMMQAQCRHRDIDALPVEASAIVGAAVRVGGDGNPSTQGPLWDVVETIEPAGTAEVFDICVPKLHNFVANDLIVHNSTYARCFSADTRVALLGGNSASLEEMSRGHDSGMLYWGYGVGASGRIIATRLDRPRFIARDCLMQVTLDNGEVIRTTHDHLFHRRDGRKVRACELRAGDSLLPLYREALGGDEYLYQPLDGRLYPTPAWAEAGRVRGARPVFRHAPDLSASLAGGTLRNHQVTAVRDLPGVHDVYCLTVPETGNFALQAGVFVDNCGIIVNVTPLEPEWEGHVTLEFSNTTPLPAKIYANEGVAQMLFFESDEVCETSYADRGGKYQKQRGVTLPKA